MGLLLCCYLLSRDSDWFGTLGKGDRFLSTAQISAEEQMIRAFVKSVEYMSPRKIGALVAIQRVRTYKNTLRQDSFGCQYFS